MILRRLYAFPVVYDDEIVTDPDDLADALNIMVETAQSTPGLLDDFQATVLPCVALEGAEVIDKRSQKERA